MLTLIIVFSLSILFIVVAIKFFYETDFMGYLSYICGVLAIISWVALVIMGLVAVINNLEANENAAAKVQLYDSLVYQLEYNLYDNDNDIGKQELYKKIIEWNTSLARGKALQRDLWVGIFYPNIYDNFDFIKLPESIS